jgi:hypothetical protein
MALLAIIWMGLLNAAGAQYSETFFIYPITEGHSSILLSYLQMRSEKLQRVHRVIQCSYYFYKIGVCLLLFVIDM